MGLDNGSWRASNKVSRRTVIGTLAASLLAACRKSSSSGASTTPASPGSAPVAPVVAVPPVVPLAPLGTPPVLGRPTATSVTFNIVVPSTGEVIVDHGTSAGRYTSSVAASSGSVAGTPVEVVVGDLQPAKTYFYRVRSGGSAVAEGSFTTQRKRGESFVFAVQGDSHPERLRKQFDASLYERTLKSAASASPDFYVCIGDDFSVDALKTVTAPIVAGLYAQQRRWLSLVGAPLFLVNGNHEQASLANLDGSADNVAVWAQTARNAHYPQPAPDSFFGGNAEPVDHIGLLRNYYSFEWGDALVVVIDPYWHSPVTVDNQFGADREESKKRDLWSVTLGNTQYRWFERTLQTSTAKHKLVFTHHVHGTGRGGIELAKQFEWGDAAGLATRRPGWTRTVHQLLVDNKVKVLFQGHDHIFVHQVLDGVVYQTLPEPANPFYTLENEAAYKTGEKVANSGHVRVRVTPAEVTVEYVRSYLDRPDELAYSYRV